MKPIPQELFDTISTDKRIRNAVAFAHGCYDAKMNFLHLGANLYPESYSVTEEQKQQAIIQRGIDRINALEALGNKLVFVGMGMSYPARYPDDVCNHRIRTEFKNKDGRHFFVELGTGRGEDAMRVDFSIDRDLQHEYESRLDEIRGKIALLGTSFSRQHPLNEQLRKYQEQPYYHYKNLAHSTPVEKYTLQGVLHFVNRNFDCKFTEIEVDYYDLRTEDFICQSPK